MKITIKELYDYLEENPDDLQYISVESKHGLKSIEAIGYTAHDSEIIKVQTESGKMIETSPEHLLWAPETNDWRKTNEFVVGDKLETIDGNESIISIETLDFKEDLMDIQVEDVHEFWANSIRSHNSTFLDAITFTLFGKPFRDIRKPQLINSINQKDCLAEIEFTIGSSSYLVRRGIRPNIFEIMVNGVLINQNAESRDYQEYLEKNILKFTHKTFKQVIALSSSSFIPFMQLKTRDRRDIIEDLLDLSIFTTMNNLLKTRYSELKQQIKDYDYQSKLLDVELNNQHKLIKLNEKNKTDQLEKLHNEIEELKKSGLSKKKEINELQAELDSMGSFNEEKAENVNELNNIRANILSSQNDIKTVQKNIEFFEENEICPVCSQKINEDHKEHIIIKDKNKKAEIETQISKLKEKSFAFSERVSYINNELKKMNDISVKITDLMGQLKSSVSYTKKILSKINELETNVVNKNNDEEIKRIEKEITNLEDTISESKNTLSLQNVALDILKDTGIKSKIINQYVPMFNKLVNKYLSDMDFFVQFELDENFNETIKSRNRDIFSYSSFSEGEKMRIDFSLLLTWRAVARLKNSVKTNLLILDEIFDSSLDDSGVEDTMKLLNTLEGNIFLISHRGDILQDKFQNVIKFHKPNNFSVIDDE